MAKDNQGVFKLIRRNKQTASWQKIVNKTPLIKLKPMQYQPHQKLGSSYVIRNGEHFLLHIKHVLLY